MSETRGKNYGGSDGDKPDELRVVLPTPSLKKMENVFMYQSKTIYCPRCGNLSLEFMPSYAYCSQCNYSPDTNPHVDLISPKKRGDEVERANKRARFWELAKGKEPQKAKEEDQEGNEDEEDSETTTCEASCCHKECSL